MVLADRRQRSVVLTRVATFSRGDIAPPRKSEELMLVRVTLREICQSSGSKAHHAPTQDQDAPAKRRQSRTRERRRDRSLTDSRFTRGLTSVLIEAVVQAVECVSAEKRALFQSGSAASINENRSGSRNRQCDETT